MSKIAITGHTRGFGKFIFERLSKDNDILGFSKSTGYDITKKTDRQNIIKESCGCDVFINNAQQNFGQTELLYEIFYQWKDTKKGIINIGSNARDFTNRDKPYDYSVQKLALNHASKQLGRISTCKVVTLDFGYLVRDNGSAIGYESAFAYLNLALDSFNNNHRLLEILVAHE